MRRREWEAFLADVRERGVLEPLHLAEDGVTVLDGRHRLKAALNLGLDKVPVVMADLGGLSEYDYIVRAATLRRHLSDDQRAILAARLHEHLSKEAKRQRAKRASDARYGRGVSSLSETSSDKERRDTRQEAAVSLNVSPWRVRQAIKLLRDAPDLAEQVGAGKLSLGKAVRDLKVKTASHGPRLATPGANVIPLESFWPSPQSRLQRRANGLRSLTKRLLSKDAWPIDVAFAGVKPEELAVRGPAEAYGEALAALEDIRAFVGETMEKVADRFDYLASRASTDLVANCHPKDVEGFIFMNALQKNVNGRCGRVGCWRPVPTAPPPTGLREGWSHWGLETVGWFEEVPTDGDGNVRIPIYCEQCEALGDSSETPRRAPEGWRDSTQKPQAGTRAETAVEDLARG